MSVGVLLRIDTGIILIGDAIQANRYLVLEEMNGVRLEMDCGKMKYSNSTNVIRHVCE